MKDASFQRADRQRTKGVSTGRVSKTKTLSGTDWKRLQTATDREIRKGIATDPDARATDEKFWKNARVVLPQPKQIVTMRLDADLLRWFRQQRGYQTRINAILRAYMSAQAAERH